MAEGDDRSKAKPPSVRCSWCGKPVAGGRMRLHQSETPRFSGNTVATFHLDCGDELLDHLKQIGRAALPPTSDERLTP